MKFYSVILAFVLVLANVEAAASTPDVGRKLKSVKSSESSKSSKGSKSFKSSKSSKSPKSSNNVSPQICLSLHHCSAARCVRDR